MSNDPVRAALERLVEVDDTVPHNRPGWEEEWRTAIAEARAALAAHPTTDEPAVPEEGGEVVKSKYLRTNSNNNDSPQRSEHRWKQLMNAPIDNRWYADLRQPAALAPVEERPWEREGWCDLDGECWWCPPDGPAYWSMANPAMVYGGWLLPHWAIPIPQPPQGGEVEP